MNEIVTEKLYIEYIKGLNIPSSLKNEIIHLLSLNDEIKRYNYWEKITQKIKDKTLINSLANPYYVGFGNPESEILILGQEKAFDSISSPELCFLESINNNFYWNKIINESYNPKLFDPRFPRAYHDSQKMKLSHTWSLYSKVLSPFYSKDSLESFKETRVLEKSFFNDCFISEINAIPSKTNKKNKITKQRKQFLSNSFFRTFKYVVLAAQTSLSSKPHEDVREIFEAELICENYVIGNYGKNNSKEKKINIYKSNSQTIITCHQLSGLAGWKNDALEKFKYIFENYES